MKNRQSLFHTPLSTSRELFTSLPKNLQTGQFFFMSLVPPHLLHFRWGSIPPPPSPYPSLGSPDTCSSISLTKLFRKGGGNSAWVPFCTISVERCRCDVTMVGGRLLSGGLAICFRSSFRGKRKFGQTPKTLGKEEGYILHSGVSSYIVQSHRGHCPFFFSEGSETEGRLKNRLPSLKWDVY